MNLIEGLDITCRTTCGCGNNLVPYTKQTETTHYLLTCKPYSERYDHPLLIAIDKNSPVFKNAEQWNKFWNELCVNFNIEDIDWDGGDFESEWFVVRANKDRQIVKRLEYLKTHPYNFGERMMDLLGLEVARDDFRESLAVLINRELQKIIEGKK